MEVEVKIRLPDADALAKLSQHLSSTHKATYEQENYFFDGVEQELSSQRAVLRVRFYNKDAKATITLKGKQVLKDGIGRAPEQEETVDPTLARTFLEQPDALLNLESPLMQYIKQAYSAKGLKCQGGFQNTRNVHSWEGHELELDATRYGHGNTYEVECETDKPEQLRAQLEDLLKSLQIPYEYSKTTKFANFINKTLV